MQPFPNNPLFQPRPPLSDALRQEVYEAFVSDPETWTVRKLATKYNISLKRVEAILKLKAAEKEMEINVNTRNAHESMESNSVFNFRVFPCKRSSIRVWSN